MSGDEKISLRRISYSVLKVEPRNGCRLMDAMSDLISWNKRDWNRRICKMFILRYNPEREEALVYCTPLSRGPKDRLFLRCSVKTVTSQYLHLEGKTIEQIVRASF